jgi:putative transposase
MPRTARASAGNVCYHVLNRGNGRAEVFHKPEDYAAFVDLMVLAQERLPLRILGYALMPNHFHLVLWPHHDGDLSRWMQWLLTSHVRRYHRHYQSDGHVWQGRFKAFPIAEDEHLQTTLRYAERNPLRAGLVKRAEDWQWSSLYWRGRARRPTMLSPWPIPCPRSWIQDVNSPQTEAELAALRKCLERGAPFGDEEWAKKIARKLGLEASLRPRGRPKKVAK